MLKKGFTLIEVLVAVAIISIIAVVSIPNLKKFSQNQTLTTKSDNVLNSIRQAQANAQSGVKCKDGNNSVSWSIIFKVNPDRYSTSAICRDASGNNLLPAEQVPFKNISPAKFTAWCKPEGTPDGSEIEVTFDSVTYTSSKKTTQSLPCSIPSANFIIELADSRQTLLYKLARVE